MVKRHWRKLLVAAGATLAVGVAGTGSATAAPPSSPEDAVAGAKDLGGGARYNAGHAIFVAKDLGGGSYWLGTTTAQEGLVAGSEAGRDGLLTVNDSVLVPAEQALDDL